MAWNAASFGLFFNANRAARLTPADNIMNLARTYNYPLFMMMKGQNLFNTARGGSAITEVVKITDTGTFGAYTPGAFASVNGVNTSVTMSYQYRFYRSHVMWTDAERKLSTAGGTYTVVKNYADAKEQDRVSEHVRGLDGLCFARPNYTSMEAAPAGTGVDAAAYSIPAWIAEDTVRYLPPTAVWGTNALGGLDPTAIAAHRNQVSTYDHTDISNGLTGIISAFDDIEISLKLMPIPGVSDKQMQSTSPTDLIIYTNKDGLKIIKSLYRNAQDRWNNQNDAAWNLPTFDGIPFVACPQLDTELLEQSAYAGGTSAYTGLAYTRGKPRYFWVNKTTLHPVFQEDDILSPEKPMVISGNQPDTTVVWTQSMLNIPCNARNRNGIVAPTVPG